MPYDTNIMQYVIATCKVYCNNWKLSINSYYYVLFRLHNNINLGKIITLIIVTDSLLYVRVSRKKQYNRNEIKEYSKISRRKNMITVIINTDISKGTINRNVYGHFAEHLGRCIYNGFYVGDESSVPNVNGIRSDIVDALKKIKIPVLRWPGGCFADEYHWMDGIGGKKDRPTMVNTHWGGVTEDNSFGTHEFLELCSQLECEPYICGNVGSGTVKEMSQWVEYMTFDGMSPMSKLRSENGSDKPWSVKYFGVGNENWGCGGNMRPQYYADEYKRYQTYCRDYGDNKLFKIACGPVNDNYEWTEVLMREAGTMMDGLALHYYTFPKRVKGQKYYATEFNADQWFELLKETLRMDELIQKHKTIMDKYDPLKKVELIVDEWGTWYTVEEGTNPGFLYQQNTLRDAVIAALNFHIFHNHNDRVTMTNIAQTVNVLQSPILTEGKNMLLTPTYHIYEMFTPHHDADALSIDYDEGEYTMGDESIPHISVSASSKDGRIFVSLVNLSHIDSATVSLDLRGNDAAFKNGRILTDDKLNAHNTFENPENIKPEEFNDVVNNDGRYDVTLPKASVTVLCFE